MIRSRSSLANGCRVSASDRTASKSSGFELKDQAKDLVKAGTAKSITDAQFTIARLYGFPSWPKLKAHVESLEEVGQLKQAIDRNDIERVKTMMAEQLDADSKLAHRRFPELDCGSTGARRLLLQGATLLHVAAEFGIVEAARLLLDRGADVDARATVDDAGVGGQTAIFHAVTQVGDRGLPMAQLLVERGADLKVRVKLPGHYERLDEVVECTPLGYALRFQNESHSEGRTVAFLRERGAIE
jgi:hypothetical protein